MRSLASSCGTDADKGSLRAHYRAFRARLPRLVREAADAGIANRLMTMPEVKAAPVVLAYVSFGSEVDTLGVISGLLSAGRRVAVPRCDEAAHSMAFCEIHALSELAPGAHGILEPVGSSRCLGTSEMLGSVCLVPGLTFDASGRRIGYGGGYYDRFLAFYPGHKLGLCRSMQLSCAELPHDANDIAVDFVVTEAGVITTSLEA